MQRNGLNTNSLLELVLSLPSLSGKVRMGVEQMEYDVYTPSLALPLQGGGDTGAMVFTAIDFVLG